MGVSTLSQIKREQRPSCYLRAAPSGALPTGRFRKTGSLWVDVLQAYVRDAELFRDHAGGRITLKNSGNSNWAAVSGPQPIAAN
jgi:hypothetical protein